MNITEHYIAESSSSFTDENNRCIAGLCYSCIIVLYMIHVSEIRSETLEHSARGRGSVRDLDFLRYCKNNFALILCVCP